MSKERKKAKIKPVKKIEPKKRPAPEPEPPKQKKTKTSTDKYVKVSLSATQDETRAIGERVQRGELKWAYYAGEGEKGYIYYLVIKKES